ncbi:MAG: alpha-glucosidase C-terminal domain-containing protein [Deltaproteobacteria bacterium]|nr:alpha-glucosidase C-terminal domain-containing protein [Deltaproteobacteria bacterium]
MSEFGGTRQAGPDSWIQADPVAAVVQGNTALDHLQSPDTPACDDQPRTGPAAADAKTPAEGLAPIFHDPEPDYTRPRLVIPQDIRHRIFEQLRFLYSETVAKAYMPELERILEVYYAHKPPEMIRAEKSVDPENRFTEKDVILITYWDLLRGKERSPLATLARFCDTYLQGNINTIHILPFFPYSSDRGFSIIDFETVDPHLGTWEDIEALKRHYQLMFDGVINHVSSKSRWFQEFRNGNPYYWDFFMNFSSPSELTPEQRKRIFRPRTSDVLTRYDTINGPIYVWTTFSEDQIDLNYQNPDVLLRVIEILLMYVRRGADIIRLDAVTYLWAQPGTGCANLSQTHEIVKLFREILNLVAPGVALITETNVPHEENIRYFGNGHDEAQMVYNFALPPLVLYTLYKQDATRLSRWAQGLTPPSRATTFFNFLDSHDGIGLSPVKNILPASDIDFVIQKAREHGAYISYKTGEHGVEEPYEINVTWFSALNREDADDEDVAFQVKRFVASRIIALVLQGVPGIYLHSLIGTPNDIAAVLATHSNRDINRTVIDAAAITEALKDPLSKVSRINRELGRLITIRTKQPAFHPAGPQKVLMTSPKIFSVLRSSPDGRQHILAMINIANETCHAEIDLSDVGLEASGWVDLVSGMEWMADQGRLYVTLLPYDVMWLEPLPNPASS